MAEKPQQRKPPRRKKAWRRPRVKTGQLFESNSMACGKTIEQVDMCQQIGMPSTS